MVRVLILGRVHVATSSVRIARPPEPTPSDLPMKVLEVIDGLGTGGAERSLAELAPLLEAQGFELEVAFFHERSPGVEDALRREGIPLRRIRGRNWFTRSLRLRREIRRFKPALVHATL